MDETALLKLTQGLYVLGARDKASLANERLVGSTVDAVMQVANKPLIIALSCNNNSYTRECIIENGEFTLSVLSKSVDPFVVANFGFQTSRNVDKWDNVKHYLVDGMPYLDGNIATLKADVVQMIPFESNTLFIAEVADGNLGKEDEALTYNYYRDSFKDQVFEAMRKHKESL
jgi:flavin reductase (DIM6/NTAB) family NADH-FMN oxidoreductase RutF